MGLITGSALSLPGRRALRLHARRPDAFRPPTSACMAPAPAVSRLHARPLHPVHLRTGTGVRSLGGMASPPDRDDTGGLRERKKRENRRALQIAALELVAERGLSDVRVEDIAHRAKMSPRTFFNYFTSKEQALVDPTPDHGVALRDRILAAPPGQEARDVLLEVLIDYALELAADRTTWRLVKEVTSRHPELLPLAMGSSRETSRMLVTAVAERMGTDPMVDPYPVVLVEAAVATLRAAAGHFLHRLSGPSGAPTLTDDDAAAVRAALRTAADTLRAGFPAPHPAAGSA